MSKKTSAKLILHYDALAQIFEKSAASSLYVLTINISSPYRARGIIHLHVTGYGCLLFLQTTQGNHGRYRMEFVGISTIPFAQRYFITPKIAAQWITSMGSVQTAK